MSQTREQRIFLHWKSVKRSYDYRRGEGQSVFMILARRWRMPIREVRAVIEEQKRVRRETR